MKDKNNALYKACMANDLIEVRRLLEEGADPHAEIQERTLKGTSIIQIVSFGGRDAVLAELLMHTDDPDRILEPIYDKELEQYVTDVRSALMIAAERGHPKCVSLLLTAGADPNFKNLNNWNNPLHSSASSSEKECASLLLKAGADPNSLNKYGGSPLLEAVAHNNAEVARELISVTDKKNFGNGRTTALHSALMNWDNEDLISVLIPFSDKKAKNNRGESCLSLAAQIYNADIVSSLLVEDMVKDKDDEGRTALMRAARGGRVDNVKLLLAYSDPDERDERSKNALMYAVMSNSIDCVKELLPVTDLSRKSIREDVLNLMSEDKKDYLETDLVNLVRGYIQALEEGESLNADVDGKELGKLKRRL